MDPVTHTLLGATLAQTGLKQRTALGTTTLVIGANIPDVDALAYFWGGDTAVWFRRGLTHGVLALAVLPLVLTGLILLWDRWFRKPKQAVRPEVIPKQILLLAVIAVTSHPLLDFLNSYGMRFLAPFSYRWFYGDTLFIIDPWVWVALAAGCWASRRATQAPKLALTVATLYVALMAASNVAARAVIKQTALHEGFSVQRVMAAPAAVTPFTRWVVVEDASGYQVGLFSWLPRPSVDLERLPYERDPSGPAMTAAASELGPRKFLAWARFPYFLAQRRGDATEVHIGDARYTLDPEGSWASTSVTIRLTDQ